MKTILCFGDSNTWGWSPSTQQRFPRHIRWTGVLQYQLGNAYHVIEEGLCGRTTLRTDLFERYTNGKEYLIPCLSSHKPIDLVIIMLGTNDLKHRFAASALNIAKSAGVLVRIVQRSKTGSNGTSPKVLLIAPPPIRELADYSKMFRGAETKSKEFGRLYEAVAQSYKCAFLDAAKYITSSNIDGIHLEANEHLKLGEKVACVVKDMLPHELTTE
ncbi:SGNH/GDSL hydrolase family protein [Gloeocapsopsis dulcis]|uniref:Hydrolase n=1 Tax=Gloeocapsopsis dulcis AAB1 = 1H9 TaxID=1433147 RepID=A0A6N8G188_9CHRO|nr:SGNH/GDSL hydrolase family protein [Gloeocapsopsis dulcis]MUL39093.1 hydrolase [Gloeocapsopsis dulcis AAB1 = 1H9]WNN88631.1 SGNH/GDSL hydrolase family protein [Gloeocapsopsis dulcis]